MIENISSDDQSNAKIAFPIENGFKVVKINSILYCQSDINYTKIFLNNGTSFILSKTLKIIEELLPNSIFLRVHKSYLVNFNYVTYFNRSVDAYIELSNYIKIPVSTRKKMMLFINYRVSKFLLLLLFFATAQSQNYLSTQLSTNQGLPDNNVCSILKDKENRLWVGTNNGLALLQGKSIQIFKKIDGLAHNSCWAIVQDKKNQIWVGTFGGGLSLYKDGKFQNFTIKNGLPSNKIRRLYLRDDDLFIGTANGFSKINVNTYKVTNYPIKDKSTIYGLNRDFEVLSILEVNHNIVFNTHSHGIYILKNDTVNVLNKTLYSTFLFFKKTIPFIFLKMVMMRKGSPLLVLMRKVFWKENLLIPQ